MIVLLQTFESEDGYLIWGVVEREGPLPSTEEYENLLQEYLKQFHARTVEKSFPQMFVEKFGGTVVRGWKSISCWSIESDWMRECDSQRKEGDPLEEAAQQAEAAVDKADYDHGKD